MKRAFALLLLIGLGTGTAGLLLEGAVRLLVPVSDGADARYPAADLEAIGAGLKLLAAGVPLAELMDLGREHAESVERTSRRAVDLFDRHVRERIQAEGRDRAAAERELLELFNQLLEASGTLVRHHFERTLLRAAREHVERPS